MGKTACTTLSSSTRVGALERPFEPANCEDDSEALSISDAPRCLLFLILRVWHRYTAGTDFIDRTVWPAVCHENPWYTLYPQVRTPPISLQPRKSSPHTSIDVAAHFARYWQEEEEKEERTHLSLSCPLVVAVPASSFPLVPARSRSLCPCSSALAHVRPPLLVLSALVRERLPSFIIARPCLSSSAVRVRPPSFVFVRRRSCSPAIVRVHPPSFVPAPALVRASTRPRSSLSALVRVHPPPCLQHLPLLVLFWLMKHSASLAWWFVCIKYLVSHSWICNNLPFYHEY